MALHEHPQASAELDDERQALDSSLRLPRLGGARTLLELCEHLLQELRVPVHLRVQLRHLAAQRRHASAATGRVAHGADAARARRARLRAAARAEAAAGGAAVRGVHGVLVDVADELRQLLLGRLLAQLLELEAQVPDCLLYTSPSPRDS